jgi:hypothetical protein
MKGWVRWLLFSLLGSDGGNVVASRREKSASELLAELIWGALRVECAGEKASRALLGMSGSETRTQTNSRKPQLLLGVGVCDSARTRNLAMSLVVVEELHLVIGLGARHRVIVDGTEAWSVIRNR